MVYPTKLNKKHNKQIKNKRRKALREGRLATVTADKFTLQLLQQSTRCNIVTTVIADKFTSQPLQQSTRCNNSYNRYLHITTVTTVSNSYNSQHDVTK